MGSGSKLCSHTRRSRESPPADARGFFSTGGRSDEAAVHVFFSGGRSGSFSGDRSCLLHGREEQRGDRGFFSVGERSDDIGPVRGGGGHDREQSPREGVDVERRTSQL